LTQREPGGAGQPSPEQLIRQHRNSLVNVLVLHGTAAARDQIARVFHRESPVRGGPFIRVDCAREEESLRSAMRAWMTGMEREPGPNPLLGAGRGTLFLDAIDALSLNAQHDVLSFWTSCLEPEEGVSVHHWAGRLIVGSAVDLTDAVAAGRFLPELQECVDKVRIDLGPPD